MPVNRQPSRSKRQKQNRAQRAARAARSANAGTASAIARGDLVTPTQASAARNARAPRGSSGPADRGAAPAGRGRRGRPGPPLIPGQRAVLFALMMAAASVILLLVSDVQVPRTVEADDPRAIEDEAEDEDGDGEVTIYVPSRLVDEESPGVVALVLGLPLLITAAAFVYTNRPRRNTVWSIAMLALAAYVVAVQIYAFLFLPSLLALGVASLQTRRAAAKARIAQTRAEKAAGEVEEGGTGYEDDLALDEDQYGEYEEDGEPDEYDEDEEHDDVDDELSQDVDDGTGGPAGGAGEPGGAGGGGDVQAGDVGDVDADVPIEPIAGEGPADGPGEGAERRDRPGGA